MTHRSFSSAETRKLAAALARRVSRSRAGGTARVVALRGELGAGKTTFAKGFLRALGVRSRVTSPTFLIVKRYVLARRRAQSAKRGFSAAYHVDGYRLKRTREIDSLGLGEALADPSNIVLVEWPERLGKRLPRGALRIAFHHGARENERTIIIKGG
jgi:tRNA threonylcarbamoyladenosine biosynthesis protein TsaE